MKTKGGICTMIVADSVFINGKVITVDKTFSIQEAIAIKDGWVIDVDRTSKIQKYVDQATKVIDLEGKLILPAAHDAHAHGIIYGVSLFQIDCNMSRVKNLDELYELIKAHADKTENGQWLRGMGIDISAITDDMDKIKPVLDKASPDNPVLIASWTGHTIVCNYLALKLANVDKHTLDVEGGVIFRDGQGDPNGVLAEVPAMTLVNRVVPQWTDEELEEAILKWQDLLIENGYGSYTESTLGECGNQRDYGASGDRAIEAYDRLYRAGKLKLRTSINYYPGKDGVQDYEKVKNSIDNRKEYNFNDPNWISLNGVKLFSDGIHMSHTAWMLDDYVDAPGNHGMSCFEGQTDVDQAAELKKVVKYVHDKGYQVTAHTLGDRAVQETIDAYVEAMSQKPGRCPRHYLIHAECFGTVEMMKKAKKYGIGVSSQPAILDIAFNDGMVVGDKANHMFKQKEFLEMGIRVAGGSDSISGKYRDWRSTLQTAITRRSAISGGLIGPELAISLEQGIKMFTIEGAYQEHMEEVRGSIEVGKVADFQVLDRDIFEVNKDEIGDVNVVMTMIDGEIVFQR